MSHQFNFILLAFLVLLAAPLLGQDTAAGKRENPKKIIEYGWDVPFTDYVRDNIKNMEKLPFDGLIFKLRGGGQVMQPRAVPEEKYAPDFEAAAAIDWGSFTDNFVIMWAASEQDWFNDEHWAAILHNTKMITHAAKLARCVGICFDHEPYGFNPWDYKITKHRESKTFAEYEAKVRQRGTQFMKALESEMPGLKILTFFQLSYFSSLLVPMEPARRQEQLSGMQYGLLPAFLNGLLQEASPAVKIIDGNENAYYYTDRQPYYQVFHQVTQRGPLLIDPQLWGKYRNQVQVGQALYIDQYFGLRARKVLGHFMPLEDQQKWFEHNIYYSLATTDEYVWCYSERMNWWKNVTVPEGCAEAIIAAKEKIAAGKPLGFGMEEIVKKAQAAQKEEIAKRLKIKKADIKRLSGPAPVIDGKLDDQCWKNTAALEDFGPLAETDKKLTATTTAQVTYDDRALYIAVRCQEPNMAKIIIGGIKHDDPAIWMGDDIEFVFGTDGKTLPFTHFMVNPNGLGWDGLHHSTEPDTSFNPEWQRAATREENGWLVEVAFPWAALLMKAAPAPGTTLRVNICRMRASASHELSAWSPMAGGFLEHDLFGYWTFQ